MKKKTMGLLLLCMMCGGLLTACGGKTLDMEDYITVTFSGYDTLGSPEVTVDWDGVSDKLFGKGGATVDPDHIIELDYENVNDLCNGENFTINVIIDEYDAERYEVAVKESQLTYKVKGLTEAKKVDVFQSLDVSFSGFEPEGEVSLENTATDPFLQNVVYTVERHGGLKNGDVITVKANYKPTTVEQYGCIAQERTHQYTVEGLGAYLFDRSQLDRAWLDTMVEAGAQTIEMYSDDSNSAPEVFVQMLCPEYQDHWSLSVIEDYGEAVPTGDVYFFDPKDGSRASTPAVIVVFECPVKLTSVGTYTEEPEQLLFDGTYYFGVGFHELRTGPDGTKYADENLFLTYRSANKDELYEIYRKNLSNSYVFYEPIEIKM